MFSFLLAAMITLHFSNGASTLTGDLYRAGDGARPTILLLADSGSDPRDTVPFHTLERTFNAWGYNVFAYDKRGVGQSAGAQDESLHALATDALAAIAMLKARPDVDASKLGVWGVSQGGLLGPLLATMTPDVRFVISVSGAGVSTAEQAINFRATEMMASGATEDDAREMQDFRRVLWAYYGTGLGREAAQTAYAIAKTRPWFAALQLPPAMQSPDQLDPGLRAFMQEAAIYDPLAVAQRVRVPVLYIFGAKDSIVPAAESLENLMQASARGKVRASFRLFADAGHGLQRVTGARECHECSMKTQMATGVWDVVPGFFDAMKSWLASVV